MHNDSVNIPMFTIGEAFARPRAGNVRGGFLCLRAPVACSVTLDPPQP
jgi:hypothetical protein